MPGIGPKTARRIIVELKDKFVNLSKSELPKEGFSDSSIEKDAYDALFALGFNSNDITRSINASMSKDNKLTLEEIIKNSLTKLSRKWLKQPYLMNI